MDYIIEDIKKNLTLTLDFSEIIRTASALASGATGCLQTKFVDWEELDIMSGIRPIPRFEPQGIVLTKPNKTTFLLEGVWNDLGDNGQSDGDITEYSEIDTNHWLIERLKPSEVAKKYSTWNGYHHGDKNYL